MVEPSTLDERAVAHDIMSESGRHDLPDDLVASLEKQISALTKENDCLRQKVALLTKELEWLHSKDGQLQLLTEACRSESRKILEHSSELVANPQRRSLENLVSAMENGSICSDRSEIVTRLVRELTTPPTQRERAVPADG